MHRRLLFSQRCSATRDRDFVAWSIRRLRASRFGSTALLGFALRSLHPACGSRPCLHGLAPTCRFTRRPPRRFEPRDQPSNSTISFSLHPLLSTVDRGRPAPTSGFCPRVRSVFAGPACPVAHVPALGFVLSRAFGQRHTTLRSCDARPSPDPSTSGHRAAGPIRYRSFRQFRRYENGTVCCRRSHSLLAGSISRIAGLTLSRSEWLESLSDQLPV